MLVASILPPLPLPSVAEAVVSAASATGAPELPNEAAPPEIPDTFIQYGVAFTIEQVADAGPLCVTPCVLASGGGIAMRAGHRLAGPFYYGLAYELSKQGSNNIYRLGILQQLRAEARYYAETGRVTQPFLQGAAGVAGYGNEWAIDTKGPLVSAGLGAQVQISKDTVVGIGVAYRALLLSAFTDTAGAHRPGGVASIVGIDLQLEGVDPWPFTRNR